MPGEESQTVSPLTMYEFICSKWATEEVLLCRGDLGA